MNRKTASAGLQNRQQNAHAAMPKPRRKQNETAERARIAAEQAEARAKAEAEAAKLREQDAERRRVEAEERAAREAKEREERAERDRLAAIEAERKRAAEQAERERQEREAEEKRRAADTENKRQVNREVVDDLVAAGLTEEQAKFAVTAIAKGKGFCNVRIGVLMKVSDADLFESLDFLKDEDGTISRPRRGGGDRGRPEEPESRLMAESGETAISKQETMRHTRIRTTGRCCLKLEREMPSRTMILPMPCGLPQGAGSKSGARRPRISGRLIVLFESKRIRHQRALGRFWRGEHDQPKRSINRAERRHHRSGCKHERNSGSRNRRIPLRQRLSRCWRARSGNCASNWRRSGSGWIGR